MAHGGETNIYRRLEGLRSLSSVEQDVVAAALLVQADTLKKVAAATLYEILGRMSYQGDVSIRRLTAGIDLNGASLGQDYGVGGDGADDTVALLAIFDELEEGPAVVLPYYVAGVHRGKSHKITKEFAFYDADAPGVLDFLPVHPSSTGKLGSIGICIGGRLSFRAGFNPDVSAGACFRASDIQKRCLGQGIRTTRWTELGNFVASCC